MNLGKADGGFVGANSFARAMSHVRMNSHLQKTAVSGVKGLFALLLCLGAACASAAQEAKPFVRGSQQEIIFARTGKPFIIGFWSLTCTNCRDDLALFGKLAKKYRNLDLVLVSTDSPEQKREIALTLQHYRLGRAESWVFADSFTDRLRFEVDPQWYGELPRTYFFDADGRSTAVSGKIDHDQFEHWIKSGMHNG